ncbi:MAG: hypothetical protein N3A53_06275, partial [Verrucomicrobiae bacterium]|nr:hypothetical protein [Verrucomicrobiae bacterium]
MHEAQPGLPAIALLPPVRYDWIVKTLQRLVAGAGIGVAGAALGYGALVLLTPTFGRIVGYAKPQPPLR